MSFLDQLTIASPCPANWDEMTGDARTRFCDLCQKNVYNLSSMTRQEATSLIEETEGKVCIRMYRRADGTVLTQDCPIGLQKRFERKVSYKHQGIAAVITLVAIAGIYSSNVPASAHLTGEPPALHPSTGSVSAASLKTTPAKKTLKIKTKPIPQKQEATTGLAMPLTTPPKQ